jgi:CheY-like chemotaxis protein
MNRTAPVRVLVADDHAMVRQGIVGILESSAGIEVVAEAGDGAEATRKALETRPDVGTPARRSFPSDPGSGEYGRKLHQ